MINVVEAELKMSFLVSASAAYAAAINPNDINTLLVNQILLMIQEFYKETNLIVDC